MANKDRNKRSVRKARAEERARVEAAQAASVTPEQKAALEKRAAKDAKLAAKQEAKAEKKDTKPGFFRRIGNYLGDVRSEMRRVVWPSKDELRTYSVAIVAMLIVFGVVIWLVDSGIVAALVGFTGLRG
ncbi:preprotein translocase subunit SecE [Thermophilibacter provencensis]|uniref:Protein translocase subunit SecE n=1 Tax=Thermophilibacter provencensis TaxID=1852386 RepID=A0ABT7V4T4_9ACTN|nr:preprotein translocase subunit SecE [Thermophilibacter provencensis]MDM8271605.1 preprotein translocase subunit SecE [Thermophilibacter provencensis]